VVGPDGALDVRHLPLDQPDTPDAVGRLFREERVVTVHTEEATLEDIFIQLTGRGLV
jgi:ABC-2 type transport system ATP-binding protein